MTYCRYSLQITLRQQRYIVSVFALDSVKSPITHSDPPPHPTPDWCPADSEAQRITNASCLHATCSPQPHKTLCHYRFLSPGVNWVPHTETVSISCRRTPCSSTIQYIRTLGVRWRVSGGQVQQKSEGSRERQDRFDQIYLIDLFFYPPKKEAKVSQNYLNSTATNNNLYSSGSYKLTGQQRSTLELLLTLTRPQTLMRECGRWTLSTLTTIQLPGLHTHINTHTAPPSSHTRGTETRPPFI